MVETLDIFIVRRLSEIASEESDLVDRMNALAVERAQLQAAASAVGIVIPDDIATALDEAVIDLYPIHRRKVSEKTIKETVLEILKESRRPLTALEILPIINDRLNADYPRSSLSPQLSRLKAEGLIDREGRNWSLVKPGAKKDEAAGANPAERTPTASNTGSNVEDGGASDQPTNDGQEAVEGQVAHEKIGIFS